MKDKIFSVLQRIGRSFMLPIAILPVAGLLLGIGSSFTNATTIETYGLTGILGEGTILHSLLVIMNSVGSAVFNNLPLIFAVGVAIGMAKKEKEVAALSAVIAFFVMNTAINAMLTVTGQLLENGELAEGVLEGTITSVCGIQSLQMGVFGGIIVGLGVAALHNKFYRIQLPNALSFFGGTRFVPIISTIVYMFVGILLYFIWPVIQNGIYALGGLVTGSGYFGTLIFGLIKRALVPFGLHHVFYMPFWQTAVGGTMEVAGQMVQGGQNIFFAQLADSANVVHFSSDATRYFSGEFIFMMFGLPGAALAMYQCAKPEKKKAAGGLLLSAALACMATGITEPLEFSFLFVAPALFVVQVILAGSAYMIAHILNIAVGLTFSLRISLEKRKSQQESISEQLQSQLDNQLLESMYKEDRQKSDENLVLLQQQIDKVEENHQQNCDNMLLLVNRGKNAEKWLKEQQNFLNQKQEKLAGLLEYRKLLETQISKIQTDLTVFTDKINQNQQQIAAEKSRYDQLLKQKETMEKELGERTKEEILIKI